MTATIQNRPDLSYKQTKAIAEIITGGSIIEGCERAGISKSSFYEWMKDETFKDAFIAEQNNLFESSLKDLKGLSSEAVEHLGALLRGSLNENVKLRAIALVLEHAIKAKEIEGIETRLQAIEKELKKNGK